MIGEDIERRLKELGKDLEWLSKVSGVEKRIIERILEGDLSFDDPVHVRETLKRIAWILDIELEEVEIKPKRSKEAGGFAKKNAGSLEILMVVVLISLSLALSLEISKLLREPPAVLEGRAVVNGVEVSGEYPIWDTATVTSNGTVLVRTFGGKVYEVDIERFEVVVDGRSEGSGSR